MSTSEKKGPSGRKVTVTAGSGGITSGDLHTLKSGSTGWVGEAIDDAANGEDVAIEVGHQAKIPKNTGSGESFGVGDLVYKDTSSGKATAVSSSNDYIGRCTADASTSDTDVWTAFAPTGG